MLKSYSGITMIAIENELNKLKQQRDVKIYFAEGMLFCWDAYSLFG